MSWISSVDYSLRERSVFISNFIFTRPKRNLSDTDG